MKITKAQEKSLRNLATAEPGTDFLYSVPGINRASLVALENKGMVTCLSDGWNADGSHRPVFYEVSELGKQWLEGN